jgi:hypothetical protein
VCEAFRVFAMVWVDGVIVEECDEVIREVGCVSGVGYVS